MEARPAHEQDAQLLIAWRRRQLENAKREAQSFIAAELARDGAPLKHLDDAIKSQCSYCFSITLHGDKHLKKCSACNKARYCDRDCQLKDWKAGHREACVVASKKEDRDPGA